MSTEPSDQHANAKDPAWYARAAAQPEPEHRPAVFQRPLLAEVFAHARECYPEECCGLMLGPPGAEPRQVVRCTNVQNVRLAKGESKLNASQGFWIDEQELERALRSAEARGEELRVVYHSHVDTGAYLSHTDLEAALGPQGTPLWSGVGQLVVSVSENGVREAALFEWDEEREAYVGRLAREVE